MATIRWRGDAPAIAQVDTLTPANVGIGDIFTATINGKSISVTATAATVANVTGLMTTAWNASTIPEFAEITATDSTTHVTLTADTAGVPFTVTASETDGNATDTQTFTQATTTACSGPNFYNVAANWDGAAVPTAGDDVVVDSGSNILYGLSNAGNTLTSLRIDKTYTGKVGLPRFNTDGDVSYVEYRTQYLTVDCTTVNIGTGLTGPGSGRIKLNLGTVQATINVFDTGTTEEDGIGALIIKGTHASNALHILTDAGGGGATIDVAPFPGETATLLTLNVQQGATVNVGSGVTLTNLTYKQSGGAVTLNSATSGTATLTVDDGTLTLQSGGHLGLTARGGTVIYNSTGTLGGAPVVSGNAILDFSQDLRAKTVTNPIECSGKPDNIRDPHKVVATLVLDCNEIPALNIGSNIRITRGTPA